MIDEHSAQDLDQTEADEFSAVDFDAEIEDSQSSESEDIRAADRELESSDAKDEPDYSVMVLEEVDVALVLPVWEPTGDVQVDSALEQLATLDELSVHDHAEILTSVHSSLHQRLTDISA